MKRYWIAVAAIVVLFLSVVSAQNTAADGALLSTNGMTNADASGWRENTFADGINSVRFSGRWLTNRSIVSNYYKLDNGSTNLIVWTNTTVTDTAPFRIPEWVWYVPVTNYEIQFFTVSTQIYVSVFYSNAISNYLILAISNALQMTNSLIGTNYFYYQRKKYTNEFIVFTNFVKSGGLTNVIYTNRAVVYEFFDNFPKLIDVTAYRTVNDLRASVMDFLFPVARLGISTPRPSWIRMLERNRMQTSILTDAGSLTNFSEDLFGAALDRKKFNQLEYTPEERTHLTFGIEQWDTKVIISGTLGFKFAYGWIWKDENNTTAANPFNEGFDMSQNMNINVIGKFGDRISVEIEQSSLGDTSDNTYEIAYRALTGDTGILRELKAGNSALTLPDSSHYIKFSGTSAENYGLLAVFGRDTWKWQTILSLTTSKKGYKTWTGDTQLKEISIADIAYIKRKYYVLPDTIIDRGTLEILLQTTLTNLADKRIDDRYFKMLTEGVNYSVNYNTGEVTLSENHDRDKALVMRYTTGAAFPATNTNTLIGTDNNNGDEFIYLWEPTQNNSQYMHCGYYYIGYRNFEMTELKIYLSKDTTTLSETQFQSSDYEINLLTGIIKFDEKNPFPDPYGKIYLSAEDPTTVNSINTMKFSIYQAVTSYMLDYGIIPDTEHVYVNGRELSKSEYMIVYSIGELIFKNENLINQNDIIEVTYDYKPFFAGSQQISVASRFDWKPSRIINMGSTLVYNIAQRDSGGAPSVSSTPEGDFMMDVDTTLNMGNLLGFNDRMEFTIKAEAAMSVVDENTVDYAIIDDFESSGEVYSLSSIENRWILAPPTSNISGINNTNRGKLLYKDYRNYNLDNSFTLLSYSSALTPEQILDYSYKPGPYLVLGGHLDPSDYPQSIQTSLVMDYDFTGGSWAGSAISIAGASGYDLSEYNEIVIWAKVQSDEDGDGVFEDDGSAEVELVLALGGLNEDTDGDGVLDEEATKNQAGFPFNDPLNPFNIQTYVGRGRLGEGDGYIQSEDFNKDKVFDTNENCLIFPSAEGYTDIPEAIIAQGGWRKITIRISSLTAEQVDIIEHVSAIAVYLKQRTGTRGRLLIDSIDFKSIRWQDKIVDGYDADESDVINGEAITVYNSPYYAENRFYILDSEDTNVIERAILFEKLHGAKTIAEAEQMNEISMGIRYDLTNADYNTNFGTPTGGTGGTLVKTTSYSFDISRYQFINFYIFVPSTDENGDPYKTGADTFSNETFVLVIGNGANSYYRWRLPLAGVPKDSWNKVTIDVSQGLAISVNGVTYPGYEYPLSSGFPNLQDVDYVEMGVETIDYSQPVNKGIVWVNEFYVSQDSSVIGYGFYVNPVFIYKDPLWTVNGREIFGPISFNSVYEYQSYDFISSIGQTAGLMYNNLNFSLNQRLFRYLTFIVSYRQAEQANRTNTTIIPEYLQKEYDTEVFNYSLNFNMNRDYIPVMTHAYTETLNHNLLKSTVTLTNTDYIVNIDTHSFSSASSFSIGEVIPFAPKYSIQPSFRWEDNYTLEDHSYYTNSDLPAYLTNSGVYGLQKLSKALSTGMKVYLGSFYLYGGYTKELDKFSKVYDFFGYRNIIDEIAHQSVFERYADRLKSMFEGFYFENEELDNQDLEKFNWAVTANKIKRLEFMTFAIEDSITKNRSGYSYTTSGILSSRSEQYSLVGNWKLTLASTNSASVVPKFNIKLDRSVDFSHNSTNQLLEYSDAFQFGDIYYMQPLHYSALFTGNYGRKNALELVDRFGGIDSSISTCTFADTFSVEMILPKYKNAFLNILPKRYVFQSKLVTARNSGSFNQNRIDTYSTSFPVRFSDFLHFDTNTVIRPGDLNAAFTLMRGVNYNFCTNVLDLKVTLAQSLFFKRNTSSLVLGYTYNYKYQNTFTNANDFLAYGFGNSSTNISPQSIYTHVISLTENWGTKELGEFRFWFIKLNLTGTKLINKDIVKLTSNYYDYEGSSFAQVYRLLTLFEFQHSSQFVFSEMFTATFTLQTELNRYADLVPDALHKDYTINYYDTGVGLLVQLDLSIKI